MEKFIDNAEDKDLEKLLTLKDNKSFGLLRDAIKLEIEDIKERCLTDYPVSGGYQYSQGQRNGQYMAYMMIMQLLFEKIERKLKKKKLDK